MKVDFVKVLEALEMVGDNSQAYLNADTGEIEWLGDFLDSGEYEEKADRIEFGNFISLPSKYEIHEYKIMEDFIFPLPTGEIQDKLYRTIKGKGAFRRFKDAINYLDVAKDWYSFRDEAYKNIALDWCKQNGLD